MTDIDPSSRQSESELAARLLAAGRRETPSARSVQRTLSALGLGAAALGASGAATAAAAGNAVLNGSQAVASIGVTTLLKFIALGAAGGLVFAVSAERLTNSPEARSPAQAALRGSPAHSPAARRAQKPSLAPVAADSTLAANRPVEAQQPSVSAASASPVQRLPPVPSDPALGTTPPVNSPLASEIAFVDRGRSAFQRGDLASALAVLESYERSFPDPRLLPEVLYLRMAALQRVGQTGYAIELARRLVREFPSNPQAASARAVLDGARSR